MAQKTIKKTQSKKTAVKKSAPVAKKTVKKTVRTVVAPVVENTQTTHECHCGNHCCCRGNRFVGFCIKLFILCMVFLLGCLSAPWIMGKPHHNMMKQIKFNDNGCVMLESVKCPKMLEALATADDNADGCITRAEVKHAMHEMHKAPKPESVEM